MAQDKRRFMLCLAPILASVLCLWVYADRIARELPVGFVDQDRSALSRNLGRSFDAAPQIALRPMRESAEVNEALLRGEIRGAIIIANGLSESVREGRTGVVSVWRDGSMPVPSNQIYAATAGVVSTQSARQSVGRLMAGDSPARRFAHPRESLPRLHALHGAGLDSLFPATGTDARRR
jgi:ABC-2 type transport system permease protein